MQYTNLKSISAIFAVFMVRTKLRLWSVKKTNEKRHKTEPLVSFCDSTNALKRNKSLKFFKKVEKGENIVNQVMFEPSLKSLCELAMANQLILEQLIANNSDLKSKIEILENQIFDDVWVV